MKLSTILIAAILMALACEMEGQISAPTSSPSLEATVQALVNVAPTTEVPAHKPDIEATVQALVEATAVAIPNIAPIPIPTPGLRATAVSLATLSANR